MRGTLPPRNFIRTSTLSTTSMFTGSLIVASRSRRESDQNHRTADIPAVRDAARPGPRFGSSGAEWGRGGYDGVRGRSGSFRRIHFIASLGVGVLVGIAG